MLIFQINTSTFIFGTNFPFYHWNELLGWWRLGTLRRKDRKAEWPEKGMRGWRRRSQWSKGRLDKDQVKRQGEARSVDKVWGTRREHHWGSTQPEFGNIDQGLGLPVELQFSADQGPGSGQGSGPSLERLRLQRQLSQDGDPPRSVHRTLGISLKRGISKSNLNDIQKRGVTYSTLWISLPQMQGLGWLPNWPPRRWDYVGP